MIFQTAEWGWGEGVHGLLFLIPPTLVCSPESLKAGGPGWEDGRRAMARRAAPTKEAG